MNKTQKTLTLSLLLLPLSLISCGSKQEVTMTVANETGEEIGPRILEINANEILGTLRSEGFFVTDGKGREVAYQVTYDSLILIRADVAPGDREDFVFHPADTLRHYDGPVYGKEYPARRDDVAYENDFVGFRIYGPGTQNAGEKAYGYDLFFKYPGDEIVVPQLYAPEIDPANRAKVDSLRAVDPEQAEEFIRTFSYHLDHGKGMDCYAVGATLGAGVAAIADNDSIYYPWCYEKAQILDNGPLRFTLRLDFAPVNINGEEVTEHRLLTLDAGQRLNVAKVWYDGLSTGRRVVAGFPLRDDTPPAADLEEGFIAYSDPTQGPDNGRALLGLSMEQPDSILTRDNHILVSKYINPHDSIVYKWGFSWNKTDMKTLEEWTSYLRLQPLSYTVTLH